MKLYEWHTNMDILMESINLNKIEFLNDRSVMFSFLNSYDGHFYKKILCRNVWRFMLENDCEKEDEFPFFICDVRRLKLKKDEAGSVLKLLGYGFNVPISNEYNLLCMNSGEIKINLFCEMIEISEIQ